MKIGIYSPYLETLTGGEKYILTAAACLTSSHTVSLFWDGNERDFKEKVSRKFGLDLQKISFRKNIFSSNIPFRERLFQSKNYDRIIVLSDGSIPFVWPKLILHFQTPMEWINMDNVKTFLKMKRVYRVVCNSFFTKKYIDRKFSTNSYVIYPPVEIHKVNRKKENVILNVGRYGIYTAGSSYKKQEVLIEIFKEMINKGLKKWKLILVLSMRNEDIKEVEKLKVNTKGFPIEFVINPDNTQLWELYNSSKIYWHASGFGEDIEKHPDRAEHFGMATAEAMGVGTVPVVINTGGQPEIVVDGESGFLWNTKEELIHKTTLLMEDNELRETMAKNGEKRVEVFKKQRFCEEFLQLIS